jgi:chromate transporter
VSRSCPSPSPSRSAPPSSTSLRELALLFARLGATAFGGPAAHIAMMRDDVVNRRKWLSEERFLDLLGATNLIPGPNSTELALHIGWERRRLPGLLVAGVAFIVPAMLVTGALGWAYVRFGALPSAGWLLYGVKPVILSVVAQAIWGLLPRAAQNRALSAIGALAALLSACGVHELLVLLCAGLSAIAIAHARSRRAPPPSLLALGPGLPLVASAKLSVVSLPQLFWVFFKTGSVLFGSGYVLLAFLRADLVERLHWLSPAQLIDAIAVGQMTPGPVFTTATFIGYLIAGPSGAVLATAGIFLPAFFFVAISGPLIPRLRASATAAAFLDGVNVASLALMAVVTVQLGRAAIVDPPALLLALTSAVLLLRFKLNSAWLVLGGAAAGFAIHALGLGAG